MLATPFSQLAIFSAVCLPLVYPCSDTAAATADSSKLVVVLYPVGSNGSPGLALADRGIRSAFGSSASVPVEVHDEYLDIPQFPDPSYQQKLAKFLREKYADRKVDAVVVALADALDFAITYGDEIFPNVPTIFTCIDQAEVESRKLGPHVIGCPITMELKQTLEVALQLHPKTEQVFVVVGKSKFDAHWEQESRRVFGSTRPGLKLNYLSGLPMPDLLQRVASLPERSVIYYLHVFEDGDGVVHIPADVLTQMAGVAKVPIYSHVNSYVGRGIVGGRVFSFEEEGKRAAGLALRLFQGESPRQIGIQKPSENAYVFDWRQLRRFGISEAKLPADSILEYKVPTVWDEYKWHIVGLAVLCIAQAVLIAGLVTQRVRRARAETQLRHSQGELQDLTGKLLIAQEVERRRIACELHDDFGQEMALLSVEIDLLRQKPESDGQHSTRIFAISDRVKQLSSSIHGLSHQLHPMKLEQLGPVAAIRGLCKELTQSHSVNIEFSHHEVPKPITQDIALCLYRIAQESLRNVIKHSGAQNCDVELSGDNGAICLRVHDDGLGFDPRGVDAGGGLGLVSMRERLRAIGGEIALKANPRGGTEIVVRIPCNTGS